MESKDNECYDDDIESTISNFSMISIAGGEEISADQALDDSCADIQKAINLIHSYARQVLMCDERGDDYSDVQPLYKTLCENVDEGISLLRELKRLVKQLVPPAPRKKAKPKPKVGDDNYCGAC